MNNYWIDTEFFNRYKLEKGWEKAKTENLERRNLLELKIEEAIRRRRVENLRKELLVMELQVFCAKVGIFKMKEKMKEVNLAEQSNLKDKVHRFKNIEKTDPMDPLVREIKEYVDNEAFMKLKRRAENETNTNTEG